MKLMTIKWPTFGKAKKTSVRGPKGRTQTRMYGVLVDAPRLTTKEIADRLSISAETAAYHVREMKSGGTIVEVGRMRPKHKGRWIGIYEVK